MCALLLIVNEPMTFIQHAPFPVFTKTAVQLKVSIINPTWNRVASSCAFSQVWRLGLDIGRREITGASAPGSGRVSLAAGHRGACSFCVVATSAKALRLAALLEPDFPQIPFDA